MTKPKYFIILLFCFFAYLGITNTALAETNIDFLDIPKNQTQIFTRDQSPYIITTGIYVMHNAKLIIEPGTVLKFKKDAILDINGELEITGTNENFNRVILTSYNDKNIYTEFSEPDDPQPADWRGIYFNQASKGSITGAYIAYGDAMMPPDYDPGPDPIPGDDFEPTHQGVISVYYDAELSISDTTITNNYGGVMGHDNAKIKITNSEIYDNLEYGVWLNSLGGQTPIQAAGNWWGHNSGPNHQTLNPDGEGNRVNSYVIFDPWKLKNPPLIIIPGIMGSWTDWKGKWKLDPIFHTYKNLTDGFKSQGYKEDENFFPFPYNWRNSNIETAKELKEKIDEAKEKGKSPRVDIVAHSMGGLIARQYIQSDEYQNDVSHLVTLGTPHRGSPDAYLTWGGGILKEEIIVSFPFNILGMFKKSYFRSEAKQNDYDSLFKYIREKVPSVGELLPVYDYLRDAKTKEMRTYPDNYPRNEFLENLNLPENIQKLNDRIGYNSSRLMGEEEQANTVNNIRVIDLPEKFKDPENLLWPHGFPEGLYDKKGDHGLELGAGDGTVPKESADFDKLIGYNLTLPLSHNELATETFDQVYLNVTGYNPPIPRVPKTNLLQRLLFFRVHSPVDFQIIDPEKRKIGKDFTSNEVFDEIPNGFYSGFNTDLEFITIPDPINGEYKIIAQGTDIGNYEFVISSIDEEKTQEQSYQGQTQTGQNLNFKLEYSQENQEPLTPIIDENETYTIDNLTNKVKEYYQENLIKDKYVKKYFEYLLKGVKTGIERIEQTKKEIDKIEEDLLNPNLKPKKREQLEYRKWLYNERIKFHQEMIAKNLNKFIDKVNQYQPNIIEPQAANTLIKMAQNILAQQ